MTMGVRRIFVDSNILIYANVATAPFHTQAQAALQNLWNREDDLWVSRQVIREYVVTVTRPQTFMTPLPSATVIARVRYFEQRFNVADDTAQVTERLLHLLSTIPIGGKQVHDANIVATMLAYGIDHLLTHNVQDFRRYSEWVTVIPL